MVNRRRQRGYSLLEITVMLAVFGTVLAIFFTLTSEMRQWEKRLPVNYMRHPQISALMGRLRKDVLDAYIPGGPYDDFGGWTNGPKTLVVSTLLPSGANQTIVWDFSHRGFVQRHAYTASLKTSTWTARGLPEDFSATIGAVEFDDRTPAVRIMAKDSNGKVAIDQILQPRAY